MKGYTTKEDIENYLLIEIDDSYDAQIDEWIEAMELYIDHETNKDFAPVADDAVAEDRSFDGDGTKTLDIDPTTDIEEVRLSESGSAIAEADYITYPVRKATTTKLKLKNYCFPKGDQNIFVKAKWGYDAVPKDIKFAATVLVAGILQNNWQSEGEIQSMTIGRYTVTYKNKAQVDDFASIANILAYNKSYYF